MKTEDIKHVLDKKVPKEDVRRLSEEVKNSRDLGLDKRGSIPYNKKGANQR